MAKVAKKAMLIRTSMNTHSKTERMRTKANKNDESVTNVYQLDFTFVYLNLLAVFEPKSALDSANKSIIYAEWEFMLVFISRCFG